jgi:hypothetical protein
MECPNCGFIVEGTEAQCMRSYDHDCFPREVTYFVDAMTSSSSATGAAGSVSRCGSRTRDGVTVTNSNNTRDLVCSRIVSSQMPTPIVPAPPPPRPLQNVRPRALSIAATSFRPSAPTIAPVPHAPRNPAAPPPSVAPRRVRGSCRGRSPAPVPPPAAAIVMHHVPEIAKELKDEAYDDDVVIESHPDKASHRRVCLSCRSRHYERKQKRVPLPAACKPASILKKSPDPPPDGGAGGAAPSAAASGAGAVAAKIASALPAASAASPVVQKTRRVRFDLKLRGPGTCWAELRSFISMSARFFKDGEAFSTSDGQFNFRDDITIRDIWYARSEFDYCDEVFVKITEQPDGDLHLEAVCEGGWGCPPGFVDLDEYLGEAEAEHRGSALLSHESEHAHVTSVLADPIGAVVAATAAYRAAIPDLPVVVSPPGPYQPPLAPLPPLMPGDISVPDNLETMPSTGVPVAPELPALDPWRPDLLPPDNLEAFPGFHDYHPVLPPPIPSLPVPSVPDVLPPPDVGPLPTPVPFPVHLPHWALAGPDALIDFLRGIHIPAELIDHITLPLHHLMAFVQPGVRLIEMLGSLAGLVASGAPFAHSALRIFFLLNQHANDRHSNERGFRTSATVCDAVTPAAMENVALRAALNQNVIAPMGRVRFGVDSLALRASKVFDRAAAGRQQAQDVYRVAGDRMMGAEDGHYLHLPADAEESTFEAFSTAFPSFRVTRANYSHEHGAAAAARFAFTSIFAAKMLVDGSPIHCIGASADQVSLLNNVVHNCRPILSGRDYFRHHIKPTANMARFANAIACPNKFEDCRIGHAGAVIFAPLSAHDISLPDFVLGMANRGVSRAFVIANLPVPLLDRRLTEYTDSVLNMRYSVVDDKVRVMHLGGLSAGYVHGLNALMTWLTPRVDLPGYHVQVEATGRVGSCFMLEVTVAPGAQEDYPQAWSLGTDKFLLLPLLRVHWRSTKARFFQVPALRFRAFVSFIAGLNPADASFSNIVAKLRGLLGEVRIGEHVIEKRWELDVQEFFSVVGHAINCVAQETHNYQECIKRLFASEARSRDRNSRSFVRRLTRYATDIGHGTINREGGILERDLWDKTLDWIFMRKADSDDYYDMYIDRTCWEHEFAHTRALPRELLFRLVDKSAVTIVDASRRTRLAATDWIRDACRADHTRPAREALALLRRRPAPPLVPAVPAALAPIPAAAAAIEPAGPVAVPAPLVAPIIDQPVAADVPPFVAPVAVPGEVPPAPIAAPVVAPVVVAVEAPLEIAPVRPPTPEVILAEVMPPLPAAMAVEAPLEAVPAAHVPVEAPAPDRPPTPVVMPLIQPPLDAPPVAPIAALVPVEAPLVIAPVHLLPPEEVPPPPFAVAAPAVVALAAPVDVVPDAPVALAEEVPANAPVEREPTPVPVEPVGIAVLAEPNEDDDALPVLLDGNVHGVFRLRDSPNFDPFITDALLLPNQLVWPAPDLNSRCSAAFYRAYPNAASFERAIPNGFDIPAPDRGLFDLIDRIMRADPPVYAAELSNRFVVPPDPGEGLRQVLERFARQSDALRHHMATLPSLVLSGVPSSAKSGLIRDWCVSRQMQHVIVVVPSNKLMRHWRAISDLRFIITTQHRLPANDIRCRLLLIDECYSIDRMTISTWLRYARLHGARVVLCGDPYQRIGPDGGMVATHNPLYSHRRLNLFVANAVPAAVLRSFAALLPPHQRQLVQTRSPIRIGVQYIQSDGNATFAVNAAFRNHQHAASPPGVALPTVGECQGTRCRVAAYYAGMDVRQLAWLDTHMAAFGVGITRATQLTLLVCSPDVRDRIFPGCHWDLVEHVAGYRSTPAFTFDGVYRFRPTDMRNVSAIATSALDRPNGRAETYMHLSGPLPDDYVPEVPDVFHPVTFAELQEFIYANSGFDLLKDHSHAVDFLAPRPARLYSLTAPGSLVTRSDVRSGFIDAHKMADVQVSSSDFESLRNFMLRNLTPVQSSHIEQRDVVFAGETIARFKKCFFGPGYCQTDRDDLANWLSKRSVAFVDRCKEAVGITKASTVFSSFLKTQAKVKPMSGFAGNLNYGQQVISHQPEVAARFAQCQARAFSNLQQFMRPGAIIDCGFSDHELSRLLRALDADFSVNTQLDISRQDASHNASLVLCFVWFLEQLGVSHEDTELYLAFRSYYAVRSLKPHAHSGAVSWALPSGDPFTLLANCFMMLCVIADRFTTESVSSSLFVQKGDDYLGDHWLVPRVAEDVCFPNIVVKRVDGALAYHAGRFFLNGHFVVDPVRLVCRHFARLEDPTVTLRELYASFIDRQTHVSADELQLLTAALLVMYDYLRPGDVDLVVRTMQQLRDYDFFCRTSTSPRGRARLITTNTDCASTIAKVLGISAWKRAKLLSQNECVSFFLSHGHRAVAEESNFGFVLQPGVVHVGPTHAVMLDTRELNDFNSVFSPCPPPSFTNNSRLLPSGQTLRSHLKISCPPPLTSSLTSPSRVSTLSSLSAPSAMHMSLSGLSQPMLSPPPTGRRLWHSPAYATLAETAMPSKSSPLSLI